MDCMKKKGDEREWVQPIEKTLGRNCFKVWHQNTSKKKKKSGGKKGLKKIFCKN